MYARADLATLRVRKDVNELAKSKFTCSQVTTKVDFPDGMNNMLKILFTISIADVQGPYGNGDFAFIVDIPITYPFHPPSVTCLTKVWHPNVDPNTGRVMMSILGRDWRPVLSINTVLLGLQLIFLEPDLEYALNPIAADKLMRNPNEFKDEVQKILLGGYYYSSHFPPHQRQVEKQRQFRKRKQLEEDETSVEAVLDFLECPHVWKKGRYSGL